MSRVYTDLAVIDITPDFDAQTLAEDFLGDTVTARTMTATHTGVFDSIDDTGSMVLITAQGRIAVPAADIFFP